MIVYADTSGLAKLLLDEPGSALMESIFTQTEKTTSIFLAYVELRSALASAFRLGRIPADSYRSLLLELERLWAEISPLPVSDALIYAAGDLVARMRLRAYDAVHLAGLLSLGRQPDLIFACWDRELRAAARALGYTLFPEGL